MDLYQRLGIKRGASEAEIKKAYRSLAKQLHPDRNRDNPKAAERFANITSAYDLLSDADKRARYDRGEIDEQGNPKSPFGGFGSGGGGAAPGGGPGPGQGGFEGFPGGETADLSDLFEGLFGAGGAGRRPGGAGAGGFRQRVRPEKGADVPYRLRVGFIDAALLAPQRITLADGKTIDVKLPKGLEEGTRIRLAGKGQPGPAGAGDAIVTLSIAPHPFFTRDGDSIRLTLPVTLKEAVLGARIKVPTPDGAVMLTIPKGTSSGRVFRLKERGFSAKEGGRGDQLITVQVDLPSGNSELEAFATRWEGGGNPRASLGV